MTKNIYLFSSVIFLLSICLSLPINCFALEKESNISTTPLQGINFQQIDSSFCQNSDQIDMPSASKYPLEVGFDIKSASIPSNNYITEKYKYPPLVVFVFFAVFIYLIYIKKNFNSDSIHKVLGVFSSTALVCFIFISFAWAALLYLNTKITEKNNIDAYIKISPYIKTTYENLLSWVWQDHPALKVNSYIISFGIKRAYLAGDILTAVKYTDHDDSAETLSLRESILLSAAQIFYEKEQFQQALIYAKKAFILTNSEKVFQSIQIIHAVSAINQASIKNFSEAQKELTQIDTSWNNDLLNKSWTTVTYLHLSYLYSDENNYPKNTEIVNTVKKYLQLFSSHSKGATPYQMQCLYASYLEKIGQEQLASK